MKPTADQHRLAVGAAAGGITAWTAPLLVLSAVGGMALGTVLAKACVAVIARVEDGAAADVLGFLAAFGVWLLADWDWPALVDGLRAWGAMFWSG